MRRRTLHISSVAAVFGLAAAATPDVHAQETKPMSLDEAVSFALAHHPRLRVAQANAGASLARVDEARTGVLPDLGVSAQVNRSTGNTIPGAFFSIPGFAPIAGPTRGRTIDGGNWQSGVSVWASWDVMSFAKQAALVDVALAGKGEAEAATTAQRLEIAYAVADAYLSVVAAQETIKAARANAERAQVFGSVVKTLVAQDLRPGADAARADAELAVTQIQIARALQAEDVRRAQLAEAMGSANERVDVMPGALMRLDGTSAHSESVPKARPDDVVANHPLVQEANAAIVRTKEIQRSIELEYLPRIDAVAALWLRGSGLYSGTDLGAAQGLVPDIPNWAVGATATWNVFDIPMIRARVRVAAANQSAANARRDEAALAVAGQLRTASAVLQGALRVAENTPPALTSARAAEAQATARYRAGLATEIEVADAQRLLAQAELDDALARIEIRRAALLLARAAGDLNPFMSAARAGGAR